ncbi:MAG: glycosyltransferase family 10 [Clostridia bacterium]|nr:glycosyltransferase family 10 [Clostridia bacterium]
MKNVQIGFVTSYDRINYKNLIFNPNSHSIGQNLEYPFVCIKNEFNKRGIGFDSLDMKPLAEYDKVICFDIHILDISKKNSRIMKIIKQKKADLYLIIIESELIIPNNWNKDRHDIFKKVFTWNEDLVDNNKYIKYYWPNKVPENININLEENGKLCTIIAGNKTSKKAYELYSERVRVIRWFEENHPQDFDLYGTGWDEYTFRGPKAIRALNRVRCIKRLFADYYPSYRGLVSNKNEVLRKYKFSICFENAKGINGYITEKIFDCFFAGCVPVYMGAPNIYDVIPGNTFIDMKNFSDYNEMYSFLKNMPDDTYRQYLNNIKSFVHSSKFDKFKAEKYAELIVSNMLEKGVVNG